MQLLICMYQKHYILIQSHSSVLLQFLAARVVPVKLPTPCINLTSLSIPKLQRLDRNFGCSLHAQKLA